MRRRRGAVKRASVAAPGGEVLVVASSDMSHYLPDAVTRRLDQLAVDRVLALDPAGLFRTVEEHDISMCGYLPATAMLVCALCVVPIIFAANTTSLWLAVTLVGIAAAAHQGWSANIFTFSSDMFPRRAVGSVVGFGGMAGAVGGMLIAKVTGYLLEWTGSYYPVFLIAGFTYLAALLVMHLLVPVIRPVNVD